MDPSTRLEGDLHYVRDVVERAEPSASPTAIYVLWALIVPVGFALVDYRPAWVNTYWMIAGPAGWIASAFLGRRWALQRGQSNTRDGMRHMLHWLSMLAAMGLAGLLVSQGHLSWQGLGPLIVLLLALSYFQAGLHLERPLMWMGLLMAAGYVVLLFVSGPTWTFVGIAWSLGLLTLAVTGARKRVAPAA